VPLRMGLVPLGMGLLFRRPCEIGTNRTGFARKCLTDKAVQSILAGLYILRFFIPGNGLWSCEPPRRERVAKRKTGTSRKQQGAPKKRSPKDTPVPKGRSKTGKPGKNKKIAPPAQPPRKNTVKASGSVGATRLGSNKSATSKPRKGGVSVPATAPGKATKRPDGKASEGDSRVAPSKPKQDLVAEAAVAEGHSSRATQEARGVAAEAKASGVKAGSTRAPAAGAVESATGRGGSDGRPFGEVAAGRPGKPGPAVEPPPEPQVEQEPELELPKTRLTDEELEFFRQMLLEKRRELLGDVAAMEDQAMRGSDSAGGLGSSMPIHMADLGSDTWEQEFTLGLIEKERSLVREIDEALDRIQQRTYGVCMATGRPITKARLKAKPWAKHCIEYERELEKRRR